MPEQLANNIWRLFDNEYLEDENNRVRIGGGTIVKLDYFDDPPMMLAQGIGIKVELPGHDFEAVVKKV